jgi:hypothetical protein
MKIVRHQEESQTLCEAQWNAPLLAMAVFQALRLIVDLAKLDDFGVSKQGNSTWRRAASARRASMFPP